MDADTLARATGATRGDAEKYAWHLTDGMARFGIDDNSMRTACFLGQVARLDGALDAAERLDLGHDIQLNLQGRAGVIDDPAQTVVLAGKHQGSLGQCR